MDLYKMVWSRVSDRPFTHTVRQKTPKLVGLAILLAFLVGRFAWSRVGWRAGLAFLLGILFGHFYWT